MSSHEEEYVARLESLLAGLQRDAAASQRELAKSQEQRAQAARTGEMGRDWQDVQRRIDAGATTLQRVFSGEDDSPAAQRLVDLSRENIARLADDMPAELHEEVAVTEAQGALLGRGGIAPPPPPPDADGTGPA